MRAPRPCSLLLGGVCLLAQALLGCVGKAEVETTEATPVEAFDEEILLKPRTVFELSLRAGAGEDTPSSGGWTGYGGPGSYSWTERGLSIAAIQSEVWIQSEVDFLASDVHTISLNTLSAFQGWARLCWSHEIPANFDVSRCLSFEQRQEGTQSGPVRFNLARHPTWHGRIRSLRLAMNPLGHAVQLESLSGESMEFDRSLLARQWGASASIDQFRATLPSILAPLGDKSRRTVQVPRSGELKLAFTVLPYRFVDTTFRVLTQEDPGSPRLLFEQKLPAVSLNPDTGLPLLAQSRWTEVLLGLPDLAGSSVNLILETATPAPTPASAGLAAWSVTPSRRPDRAGRPNIILISIDTLRADHLSLYGYERKTSPVIDAWARKCGVVFDQVVAPAPWTLPSHASIFTGLDALSHQVTYVGRRFPRRIKTIPEILQEAGYQTRAITADGFVGVSFGFGRGFDRYETALSSYYHLDDHLQVSTERAVKTLRELSSESPFFLFFHTYEPHTPYYPREPFATRFAGHSVDPNKRIHVIKTGLSQPDFRTLYGYVWEVRDSGAGAQWVADPSTPVAPEDVVDFYDSGIANTDVQIGRLLEEIEELGLTENTIVVLTSDHGENLGEKGLIGHSMLFEGTLRVPLVIAPPGCMGGHRVAEQVQLVDLVPTLLELTGLPAPPDLDGIALLTSAGDSRPLPSERMAWSYNPAHNVGLSVRLANRWKFILNDAAWKSTRGREEFYELSADPSESRNLEKPPKDLEFLRGKALERLELEATGTLFVIENPGPQPLKGRFLGSGGITQSVKSTRLGGGSVKWTPRTEESGFVEFTVPPGDRMELIFADPYASARALSIWLEPLFGPKADSGARTERTFPLANGSPWSVAFEDGEWVEYDRCTEALTQICRMELRSKDETGGAAPIDPETRRRLRALGYL